MPNAIIPMAAAAIGSRLKSAASAACRRPRSASNSPRAHWRNESAPSLTVVGSVAVISCLVRPPDAHENKLQRHHDDNEFGHDEQKVVGFAAAHETPYPERHPQREPNQYCIDSRVCAISIV